MRNLKLFNDAVAFTSRFVPGDFLREPRTIQEKLAWLKVFDNGPLKTRCSDKLAVRGYVEEKLGFDASVPVLGVWDDPDNIDFDALPDRFVLKCNHGSGWNVVVTDKAKLDREEAKRKLRGWLETDYVLRGYELCYSGISRKCFAEQYLGDGVSDLKDYKFICFNGVPEYCQVISDRSNERRRLNYYDMDFRFVDFCRLEFPNNASLPDEKPAGFETMKEFARILSADFKCVRVDFFEFGGRVYVGELTLIPGNGRMKYRDDPKTGSFLGSRLRIFGEPTPLPAAERIPESRPRPDVTVVVPVYNGNEFVRDCVACLKAQTHVNAEFVVVDDKSSDGSAEAFEEATTGDDRFRIFRHDKRTDLFHARRTGVLAARGRYVMFLDVDDLLVPDACRTVAESLDESGADLFCYGTTVENIGETSEKDLADSQIYLDREPVRGFVSTAEECRSLFFGPRAWSASAWNKALKTEIAKAVFESVRTERNLGCAQDFFQSVLVFLRIRSLRSDVSRKLYVYRMGRGVSRLPKGAVTREKFERILTAAQVEAELRDQLDADGTLPEGFREFVVEDFSCRIRNNTLRALWNLPDELVPWGFDATMAAWGTRALSSPAFDVPQLWNGIEAVKHAGCFRNGRKRPERIGLYLGDEPVPEGLPASVLPIRERSADGSGGEYSGGSAVATLSPAPQDLPPRKSIPQWDERIRDWEAFVRERNPDAVVFAGPTKARFSTDVLVLRSLGVDAFVLEDHPFPDAVRNHDEAAGSGTTPCFDWLSAIRLATTVFTSDLERTRVFRNLGIRSVVVPGPPSVLRLVAETVGFEGDKPGTDDPAPDVIRDTISVLSSVLVASLADRDRERNESARRRKEAVEARDRNIAGKTKLIEELKRSLEDREKRISDLSTKLEITNDRIRRLESSLAIRIARIPGRILSRLFVSGGGYFRKRK